MKLSRFVFRILLPVIYFVLALFPVVGIIVTIAEGPNPFGFLLVVSEPGLRLLDLLDRLVRLPNLNGWFEVLLVVLLNIGIYFFVGWALDAIVNRYRKTGHASES
jgi:hypothetical protein